MRIKTELQKVADTEMFALVFEAWETHFLARLVGKDILGLGKSMSEVMNRGPVCDIF